MDKITEHKTKLFDSECGKVELLVGYDETIHNEPDYKIEFHGIHTLNDSHVEIILTSVEIVIPNGMAVDIIPNLNYHQKQYFIDQLTD